jgi:hypothetical protein
MNEFHEYVPLKPLEDYTIKELTAMGYVVELHSEPIGKDYGKVHIHATLPNMISLSEEQIKQLEEAISSKPDPSVVERLRKLLRKNK